jgi:hypothetical protein
VEVGLLEGTIGHEVGQHSQTIVDDFFGSRLQEDEKGFVNLGLNHHSTELLDAGQVGHHSKALAADLFVIDLDHVVDEGLDELYLHHLVFWVRHEEFLVVEENVGEAAEDGGDEFLNYKRSTAQRSRLLLRSRIAFNFFTSSR